MEAPDLASLMRLIGQEYPFTQERYPKGDLSTPDSTLAFAVMHSHKHMSKTSGQIAAQTERHDHGGRMNLEDLKVAAAKSVVNALNLANALGMTAQEVAERIPVVMKVS